MPGQPTFSTEAAKTLVDAYLAQPEDSRDLRKVLAWAKGRLQLPEHGGPSCPALEVLRAADATVEREIAGMSKSQAYELLRNDPRYQPTTAEQADELAADILEQAREIIADQRSRKPQHRSLARLKDAQRLVHQVQWSEANVQRTKAQRAEERLNGLTGLLT